MTEYFFLPYIMMPGHIMCPCMCVYKFCTLFFVVVVGEMSCISCSPLEDAHVSQPYRLTGTRSVMKWNLCFSALSHSSQFINMRTETLSHTLLQVPVKSLSNQQIFMRVFSVTHPSAAEYNYFHPLSSFLQMCCMWFRKRRAQPAFQNIPRAGNWVAIVWKRLKWLSVCGYPSTRS